MRGCRGSFRSGFRLGLQVVFPLLNHLLVDDVVLRVKPEAADSFPIEPIAAQQQKLRGIALRLRLVAVEDRHEQLHVRLILRIRVLRQQTRFLETGLLRVFVASGRDMAGEVIGDDFAREADDLRDDLFFLGVSEWDDGVWRKLRHGLDVQHRRLGYRSPNRAEQADGLLLSRLLNLRDR